jgi:acyl-Coa thioesterase superfamily protein/acyl-CoA thioesterase superfamily protein
MSASVYTERDGMIVATECARGPWDANAQHGGAPAALLARAFEQLVDAADGLVFARLTFELMRPVPLGELSVNAAVVRPGKRVQLLEGTIHAPDGVEVVRARALRVLESPSDTPATPAVPPPPGPEHGELGDNIPPFRPMFAPDAIEIRFVSGTFGGGPSTAWFRLRAPIVAGEEPTPLQRLAAAGDFGNGISAVLPWGEYLFINPDLTLYVERMPVGEWICLKAQTFIAADGIGTAESVLYDSRGRVGRATQALLIAPL